jgi:hypothetical protein
VTADACPPDRMDNDAKWRLRRLAHYAHQQWPAGAIGEHLASELTWHEELGYLLDHTARIMRIADQLELHQTAGKPHIRLHAATASETHR